MASDNKILPFRSHSSNYQAEMHSQIPDDHSSLKSGGGGGTLNDMERVWKKLEDHDRRFTRIEDELRHISVELSNAKFWFVGTAAAIMLSGLGLVYAARQDTTATVGAALSAIQTVVAVKPAPPTAPPTPPQIIVIPAPQPAAPAAPQQAPPNTKPRR